MSKKEDEVTVHKFSEDRDERMKEMKLHLLNSLKKAKNRGLKNLVVDIEGVGQFMVESCDFDKTIAGLTEEVYGNK